MSENINHLFDSYPEIKRHFEEKWLRKEINKIHPIFSIFDETEYLTNLDKYLKDVKKNNRTTDHLHNAYRQFWDTYYELEIAYFLRELGFSPELNLKELSDSLGKKPETDILLRDQELVIEVTHHRIPVKIQSAAVRFRPKSGSQETRKAIDIPRLGEQYLEGYFNQEKFQNEYPNIVCFCPDMLKDLNCNDLDKIISHPDKIPKEVSALALWHSKRIICFFDNPCGKKIVWKSSKLKEFFHQK